MGDILLSFPAIRALRAAYPTARIDFLTKPAYASLLLNHAGLNHVLVLQKGTIREVLTLRQKIRRDYTRVFDLHHNLRSCLLTIGWASDRLHRFRKFTVKRRLLAGWRINLLKNAPSVPLRYLACVEKAGATDDGLGLLLQRNAAASAVAETLVKSPIALAVGARWPTKAWPVERFIELIHLLPEEHFVLLGDGADGVRARAVAQAAPERVIDLTGKTDLLTVAEVIRRCRGMVANDSGLMHLACAVDTPVAALFGSTVREFGFFPFRARAKVLEASVDCRPCTTQGRRNCPQKSLVCLTAISAQEVREALYRLKVL
ncbi:MAG: hypothetical protein A2293_02975 [Elusimicrobia bacterium RIFOXYB2_FULL_49_7]|nr:MAG: hypothetical protein A2293_02975 [Elusimicrobia bacterium RIFOXYB2_FULL_49_7]